MAVSEGKTSFVLYTKYGDAIDTLTNEEAGILFKHIFNYVRDEFEEDDEDSLIDRTAKLVWLTIKPDLKEDLIKWRNTCNERSKAGKLGAEAKKQKQANQANAKFAKKEDKQNQANQADNDNEYDSEYDNDIYLDKLDKLDKQYTHDTSMLQESINKQKKHIESNGLDWSVYIGLDYDIRPYYYTMKLDHIQSQSIDDIYKRMKLEGDYDIETMHKVFFYTLDKILKSDFKADNFIGYFRSVFQKNFKAYTDKTEINVEDLFNKMFG